MKENFFNKIKQEVKKGVVIGAVTTASILPSKNLEAQNRQSDLPRKNQTEQSMEKVNKTQWETDAMNRIKSDINQLKTKEDVITFELSILRPFVYNIGMIGAEKEAQSNYSFEEYKKMFLDIHEIEKTFNSIEKKFNIEQARGVLNEIMDMKYILEMRTSYSKFHEYKKLHNLE